MTRDGKSTQFPKDFTELQNFLTPDFLSKRMINVSIN